MTRERVRHVTYLWLVSMLLCVQCDVTAGVLEKRLVEQVTCTYHTKSLILLRLNDTQDPQKIVWYDTHSESCNTASTFSHCYPSSDYVSVKTVIDDIESGRSRVLTCEAVIMEGQTVVTKNLGNVTVSGPDTPSTGTDTTHTPSTHTPSTQTHSTQTHSTAVKAGPFDETSDNHGDKNTSDISGVSSSGDQRNSDTRDTSPLTVWMLGGVSAGLVLLAALAALLAFKLKREKRKSHSLMYLIPECLPLHTPCLPVNRNSYLPPVSGFSPSNGTQTPSVPQISSRQRHLAVRRRLSPADHNEVYLTPTIPNSCHLTSEHRLQVDNPYTEHSSDNPYTEHSSDNPYTEHSSDNPYTEHSSDNPYTEHSSDNPYTEHSSDNPYTEHSSDNPYTEHSSDNPYTEHSSEEDRTGGAEVSNRSNMAEDSSSGIDDKDIYNSLENFTEESGESVESTSA